MPKIIARKEDWVKLGYQQFSKSGVSGIVIEKMAKKLKVNKSSFYWHFSTKEAFIQAIIDYWESESTSKVISMVSIEATPEDRFDKLIELSFLKDNLLDFFFYLKKYARTNEKLALKMRDLDNQRIKFTAEILEDIGFSSSESKTKSSIFYKYLIGYHEMIRHREQSQDYIAEVKNELRHFIKY